MVGLLVKLFIKDYQNIESSEVRQRYGVLLGAVGIILNVILFMIKVVAGFLSGSVAIVADAFNNLGDAGSSIIMMTGFRMAGHKPDSNHPFGHGRIEYVTGFVVAMLIILTGFELAKTSFIKIIHPEEVIFSNISAIVLVVAVIIKLYMYYYNSSISNKLSSAAMKATAMDSFSDSVATTVVLISMLVSEYFKLNIDGYAGLLVSLFILYTGITSAKDTLDPLLGTKADKEFIDKIERFVMSSPSVLGVHDLVVHDYGPGRMMISLHAEVRADSNIMEIHDEIDNIEGKLRMVLGCHAVIHMDPIVVDDEITNRMKLLTQLLVQGIDESLTIHDFRMIQGPTHTNLIFDVVVPFEFKMSDEEVKSLIEKRVMELPGSHYAVVCIDKPYV